jgi:hypothetical protein
MPKPTRIKLVVPRLASNCVVAVTTIGHTVIPTDLLYKGAPEPISRRDVVLLTCWSRPPGHALLVLPACSRLRALGVAVFTSRSTLGELGFETSTWLYGRLALRSYLRQVPLAPDEYLWSCKYLRGVVVGAQVRKQVIVQVLIRPEPISQRDVVLLTCWSRPPGPAILVLPA